MEHLPLRHGYLLERSSPFSYRCGGCSHCCHNKAIPLNPYEVARLAEHLGLSTTDTIDRHTDLNGAILRAGDGTAACQFLGPNGCGIHPARPLACRLYPLGRHLTPSSQERFGEVVPHPQSQGDWSGIGTVGDYLRSQDVERYIKASDAYFTLFNRMLAVMIALREQPGRRMADVIGVDNWLDIDAVLRAWCSDGRREVPASVDDRAAMHIEAVTALLGEPG